MNIALIEEAPEQAKAKLKAYRAATVRRANNEYADIMKAYRAIAKGKPLIDLAVAFEDVALDKQGRPMLAIGRADKKECHVRSFNGFFRFATGRWPERAASLSLDIQSRKARSFVEEGKYTKDGYSMVPIIPAECMPKAALDNFFILWEVEAWADESKLMRPDRDPLLLRHITGTLYSVEAAWDLTDVERAIMAGRRAT